MVSISKKPTNSRLNSTKVSFVQCFCQNIYFQMISFFTENEGKSVQLQYDDRLHLIALTQQANHGKLVAENLSPLGALDVIGKDRR